MCTTGGYIQGEEGALHYFSVEHSCSGLSRHCVCVYYQDWHRTRPPRPATEGGILPGVSHQIYPHKEDDVSVPFASQNTRNILSPSSGILVAVNEDGARTTANNTPQPPGTRSTSSGLPFDEEAKLVYGVVLSLRNMIQKLSGR